MLSKQARYILCVLIAGWIGLVLLPWYGVLAGFWSSSARRSDEPGEYIGLAPGASLWPGMALAHSTILSSPPF